MVQLAFVPPNTKQMVSAAPHPAISITIIHLRQGAATHPMKSLAQRLINGVARRFLQGKVDGVRPLPIPAVDIVLRPMSFQLTAGFLRAARIVQMSTVCLRFNLRQVFVARAVPMFRLTAALPVNVCVFRKQVLPIVHKRPLVIIQMNG